jgi:hypothetical protein
MGMFKSWQKYTTRQAKDPNGGLRRHNDGSPIMETVEVPRWTTPETVNWLRRYGRELTQNACRDGWHINLIDFVQHQHRLPNGEECEALVMDFDKIERGTEHHPKRHVILKKREEVKAELLKPIELKAAG